MTDIDGLDALRRIARTMRGLALEAGAATLAHFRADGLEVSAKDDASPVTAADHAADEVIVAGLAAAYPEIPIVTEERLETHLVGAGPRFFLVDPLDGTKEFISGSGEFTVNIALIVDGRPLLGAVYAPARDRLFWTPDPDFAVEERDGVDRDAIAPKRRLWVDRADNSALRVVASKSHRDPATETFISRLKVARLESAGSSLKFCLVAGGEADVYPRMGRTMAWDTAAAHAVLRAAGGAVARLSEFGALEAPLTYGDDGFENPAFVAYAPSVVVPEVAEPAAQDDDADDDDADGDADAPPRAPAEA